MLSRIRDIFIKTLNKNFTEFFDVRKVREILYYYLSEFWKTVTRRDPCLSSIS